MRSNRAGVASTVIRAWQYNIENSYVTIVLETGISVHHWLSYVLTVWMTLSNKNKRWTSSRHSGVQLRSTWRCHMPMTHPHNKPHSHHNNANTGTPHPHMHEHACTHTNPKKNSCKRHPHWDGCPKDTRWTWGKKDLEGRYKTFISWNC